jgi:4-hydroxy-3-methylbut-2-enyl diphosphate reductase
MGVKRALQLAEAAAAEKSAPVWTLGPLIHNNAVVAYLAQRGVGAVNTPAEIPAGATALIRAHGLPPDEEAALRRVATVVDATCPLVKKNQQLIEQLSAEKFWVLIAGDAGHAEARGLIARAAAGAVISSLADAEKLTLPPRAALVAQTTFSPALYARIAATLTARFPALKVYPTLCAATEARLKEVREMAARCEIVVIVGDRHSANTARLAEAAERARVVWVESAAELNADDWGDVKNVGVSAGASAPDWVIAEVVAKLRVKS